MIEGLEWSSSVKQSAHPVHGCTTWTLAPPPTALTQGTNYIPSHIIHTSVTAETLTDTLNYALESNMNM